ncbi:undecaprenyl-phosphate glucose phosphotransferase [Sphingomonas sp.]|jgi:Undecaprenyl-phosphate glucose phosphotransferase|uniref:undecaprenyl-phosphate glucose phosphotransferase n=1 Tax=Sphingomonas sp. TaxID=28214 RepID=UPI002DBEB917|nr:undecaprenyl-phosphate glucose phosphotransferase [Sphingomonas sp.]HEU4968152.1 undecaprenyl-phosphate glucose phosphotransferase [Sphingomonas sp.]
MDAAARGGRPEPGTGGSNRDAMLQETTAKVGSPVSPRPDAGGEGASRSPVLLEVGILLLRGLEMISVALTAWISAAVALDSVPIGLARSYSNAALIACLFYAALAEVTGCYDIDTRFSVRTGWARVMTAWLSTGMFLMTLGFLLKVSEDFSRGWAITWFAMGGGVLLAIRAGGTAWMRRLKKRGVFNHRVAIFGAGSQGDRLAKYILGNDKLTIDLVGFFDDRLPERLPDREVLLPLYGNLGDLIARIREGLVDQVIVALPWSAEKRLQEVVAELAITPVRIRLAPDLATFAFSQRPVVLLGDLPVMTLFERPISGFDQIIKRIEDIAVGTLATVLFSPLFLLVAIAIKLDSPGPVFFRQEREGFNNRRFRIWKFRSMRSERCEPDGITQARKDDDRITRVGRILRRTSIDELPQLFNVLAGEMSLVGPRPHAPSTKAGDRLFSDVVSHYAARHKVKPGMTGWAQVHGWRGETDTEEKLLKRLEHDLYYIENWSVLLDLYVLGRTAITLIFQKSAY